MKRIVVLALALGPAACSSFGSSTDSTPSDGGATPAGSSSCASGTHLVCEDFDHGEIAASLSLDPGDGTAAIATDASVSPPGSMRMTMGNGYPGPAVTAPLPAVHSVRCSFSVRWDQSDDRDLMFFMLGTPNTDDAVKLVLVPTGGVAFDEFSASGPNTGTDLQGSLRKGQFVPISVEIRGGSAPSYTVTVNGIVNQHALAVKDFASGYTHVEIGGQPSTTNGTGTWSIAFDDLVCDAL